MLEVLDKIVVKGSRVPENPKTYYVKHHQGCCTSNEILESKRSASSDAVKGVGQSRKHKYSNLSIEAAIQESYSEVRSFLDSNKQVLRPEKVSDQPERG